MSDLSDFRRHVHEPLVARVRDLATALGIARRRIEILERELGRGPRITHGRHCSCSSCAREDWTRSELAPCGMHGASCPAAYSPLGAAGELEPEG